jgi:hypothetical protein
MGGNATVHEGGVVHGDVVTMGGNLEVLEGGTVHGQMVTMGGNLKVREGANADNARVRMDGGFDLDNLSHLGLHRDESSDAHIGRWFKNALASAARSGLLFLFGLVLLMAAPERLLTIRSTMLKSPIRSGATGLLGLVATVVLTVVLAITIIGIPGAILVAVGAFLATVAGLTAAAWIIGGVLPISALKDRPILQLGVGVAILFLASLVPVAGGLFMVMACAIGAGAVLLTRGGKRQATAL